jgi:hypothetical protein
VETDGNGFATGAIAVTAAVAVVSGCGGGDGPRRLFIVVVIFC